MALIERLARGSIRSIDDFVTSLELVLRDTYRDIGSSDGRSGNYLGFVIDDDDIDLGVQIGVFDYYAAPDESAEERQLVKACRKLGLTPAVAIYRLCTAPTDPVAEKGLTMEIAQDELRVRLAPDPPQDEGDADQPDGDGPAPPPSDALTADEQHVIEVIRDLGRSRAEVVRLLAISPRVADAVRLRGLSPDEAIRRLSRPAPVSDEERDLLAMVSAMGLTPAEALGRLDREPDDEPAAIAKRCCQSGRCRFSLKSLFGLA
jgi:hypothetical protein